MSQIKVSAKRHLAKTISYRIISTLIGFLIMWGVTGKIEFGAAFGIIELLYKPIQYYIHERIWYKWISYGVIKSNSPQQEKRTIKKEVQPEKFIKTKPVMVKESILGIAELPTTPEIKRLTYTKKSDN